MSSFVVRALVLGALLLALAVPAAPAAPGPDYNASDNVEVVGRFKTDGTGVGAKIVGKYMYVTSTSSLGIYDVSAENAENPVMVGTKALNVQFENEEVPTNGKILGISSDTFCIFGDAAGLSHSGKGCFGLYDVSNPANPHLIKVVDNAGDHTQGCALDCTWFYGSRGTIVDARNPANAQIAGNWLTNSGVELQSGCHHVREVQPGILLGSCQPVLLMSIRPQDGGSPTKPVVLATGANEDSRFIHSSRWPRDGLDKILLVGGEKNATPQCDSPQTSAFMSWDASAVLDGKGGFKPGTAFKLLDQVKPVNGTYQDGHTPYNGLGCSVHWFEEHPTFKNGGLVALAEYENGTRFLQIAPNGKITEQGYFLPAGGSTSAPHWNPNKPNIVYTIDYGRGFDVLKWKGDLYVPDSAGQVTHDPNAVPGTNGRRPRTAGSSTPPPACASAAGFRRVDAKAKGKGLAFTTSLRKQGRISVDVFQESQGNTVVKERRVAHFTGKRSGFKWNGASKKGAADGYYFVRFTLRYRGGTDTRRLTLKRSDGKFSVAPDFYQRTDCGAFRSFKLTRPAFGGTTNAPLGITYRLAKKADAITVEAYVNGQTIKTFTAAGGNAKKRYSFTLPADGIAPGSDVQIVVYARFGKREIEQALISHRL